MENLRIPDENGCVIEDGVLTYFKPTPSHTKQMAYEDIIITEGVKVIPKTTHLIANLSFVEGPDNISLPESLERLELSTSDFKTCKHTKINLPSGYLQTSSALPANTLFFLQNYWFEAATLKDYAALYLFQKPEFLVSYCRMKLTADPDGAVKYFIGFLQKEGKAANFLKAANFVLYYKSAVTDAARTQLKNLAKDKKEKKAVEILEELELSISEPRDANVPFEYFWLDCTGRRIYKYYGETFLAFLDKDLTLWVRNLRTNEKSGCLPRFVDPADPISGEWPYYHFENTKKLVADEIQRLTAFLSDVFHSGKCWEAKNWIKDVLEEPIDNVLAGRLVWIQGDTTFTLSQDKTRLIDSNGKDYNLRKNLQVSIAGDFDVDENTRAAWKKYFADNDVKPLFEQFGD